MRYIFGVLIVFIVSCSSPKYSDNFLYGERLFMNFIDSYLKGQDVAETFFIKSVDIFQRSDDFCSLSRIYLTKFLLNEEYEDNKTFNQGKFYAESDNCVKEKNIYAFYRGENYDINLLDEYYKSYLKMLSKNDIQSILEKENNFPDYFHSRVLRSYVRNVKLDHKTSEKILEKAIEIDRFNGWTLNLLRDYILMEQLDPSQERISQIKLKIELLSRKLSKK